MPHLNTEGRCRDCGSSNISMGTDTGYAHRAELNRPVGAKGKDTFVRMKKCRECNSCRVIEAPVSCYICGSGGNEAHFGSDVSERVTGLWDHVPGLPTVVNLCGNTECMTALEKKIKALVSEAVNEGAYE